MSDKVVIRRSEWSDRERIFAFYKTAYPDWALRVPERWDWQITNNPFHPKGPPTVWLALTTDGTVIGQTMAMMEPFLLRGKEVPMGWSVDAFVLENWRGQGIGRALKEAMHKEMPYMLTINMAESMRYISKSQGAVTIPSLDTYLLRADPRNIQDWFARDGRQGWRSILRNLHLGKLLAAWVNRRRLQSSANSAYKFEAIEEFPPAVDAVWHRLSAALDVAVIRDSRYLNWKYPGQPHVQYDLFLVYKQTELIGYLVLRRTRLRGIVVDMLLDPKQPEAIFATLDFAVAFFRKNDLLEVRAGSSLPEYQECFRRYGWPRPMRKQSPLLYAGDLASPDHFIHEKWLFSPGDHDLQQPLERQGQGH